MSVNWNMGYQQGPNIGQQFQQAYEAGTQRRRQDELRNALRGVATNPDDPNAVNALIQADPVQGMQFRQQQQQGQQAASERQREQIRLGARIVRQINPRDEAGWQQALAIARQAGVDLSQVPQNFDPNYVQQLIQAGQALETQQGGQGTTLQRNYQWLQSQNPQLAETYLRNQTEGGPVVFDANGDGAPDLVPRSYFNGGGGQAPQAPAQPMIATNPQTGESVQLNPQTGQWEPVQGGPQGSPPAGNF